MINASSRRRAWARAYRYRMLAGLEPCRNCHKIVEDMTWGHLVPEKRGGTFRADNITILCRRCNHKQGAKTWHWLRPLCEELDFEQIVKEWAGERASYPRGGSDTIRQRLRDMSPQSGDEHASSEEGGPNLDTLEHSAFVRFGNDWLSRHGDEYQRAQE